MSATNQDPPIPFLRFPEFSQPWTNGSLGNLIDSLDAGVSVNSIDRPATKKEKGILKTSCVTLGIFKPNENKAVLDDFELSRLKESVTANTVIISRMNTPALVGANSLVSEDYPNTYLPDRLWAAKINQNHDSSWAGALLGSSIIRAHFSNRATGTSNSMKNITKPDVLTVPCVIPEKEEQQKIAGFLGAVDGKLDGLRRKRGLLAEYKRGVMQQLFTQEVRFVGDDKRPFADWEIGKVGDVTKYFSVKNKKLANYKIYSVTNSQGFVLQSDLFDRQIAGDDLKGYKLVGKGDFAYNPARINVGSIAQFHEENGIISSLYVCFRVKENLMIDRFFSYWLELNKTVFDINRFGEGGVRVYLWYPLFSAITIPIPSIKEQKKIVAFLTAIDGKITAVDQQIEQMETFKKGLLQQLFV